MRRTGEQGFTLIEITIIVLVLAILAAILLPAAEEFIDLARLARVREDIGLLVAVIEKFKFDTCNSFFRKDGDLNDNDETNRIDMLVGDGDIPNVASTLGVHDNNWEEASPQDAMDIKVDTIANHLALGNPYGANPGDEYTRPANDPNPFRCGWRGAYLQTPVQADPWGNRYMINVAFLGHGGSRLFGTADDNEFHQQDVFVLSAGPDEIVHTGFVTDGVVAVKDDQIAVVSGSSLGP